VLLSRKIFFVLRPVPVVLLVIVHSVSAQSVLGLIEKEMSALVTEAKPSVVTVSAVASEGSTKRSGEGFLSFLSDDEAVRPITEIRVSSGLILTRDGFIVTKHSVVERARKVFVTLYDGTKLSAEVMGCDSTTSVALLRVNETSLLAARLGNMSDVGPGSWAIVIGNSMGKPHAVSIGMVNGIREDGMLQVSANVDPGNSGSPVFNSRGEAIGLIAAVVNYERHDDSPANDYFGHSTLVWPLSLLLPPLRRIIDDYYTQHGWLGVTVNRDPQGTQRGLRVVDLENDGPGKEAGLRVDDIITRFDGQPLKNMTDLRTMVLKRKPGDKVEIGVLRQATSLQFNVEIGRRRGDNFLKATASRPTTVPVPALYRQRQ